MRTLWLLFLAGALVCLTACQPPPKPAPPENKSSFTIREIMDAMVMPPADVLWGATAVSVSVKGIEEPALKTDEDWAKVRRQAITLAEASDLILLPERHVGKPGETAKDPKAYLNPEQIDVLISKDRATWTEFAHKMHEAAMLAVKAIDEKNLAGLENAGNDLQAACEDCHKKYWFPNESAPAAPAPPAEEKK